LQCHVTNPNEVWASFDCRDVLQGYPQRLHGGVISSLLDGVMTNCMFAQGLVAVTAELRIRFRHPVATDCQANLRAWVDRSCPPLFVLKAELRQLDEIKATAEGKFVCRTQVDDSPLW
jgi:acyl-coenzyme A thioesterase PaaI-like protein